MASDIHILHAHERPHWDRYVSGHPLGTPFHLSGWQTVIEDVYGHAGYFLVARQGDQIVGVLPMVHIRHALSGNRLISLPFVDMAGVLADDRDIAGELVCAALATMRRVEADGLELRQADLGGFDDWSVHGVSGAAAEFGSAGRVRMLLDLPDSSQQLMQSLRAKLRNQVRKPIREGLECRVGGEELLDDFYRVFTINMRDLGSPVHSRDFLRAVIESFPGQARLFAVYKGATAVAASLVLAGNGTVYNPWASSLRRYREFCPNMLLYWEMLAWASDFGYSHFDFGRSSVGEGTYRFKQQWGAREEPLAWLSFSNDERPRAAAPASAEQGCYQLATRIWKRMPVPVSRVVGPAIRKHIGL